MFRALFGLLLFASSLLCAQEVRQPVTPSSTLLVQHYVAFLKAVASISDTHELYQSSMSNQIVQVPTEAGFDYKMLPSEGSEPMQHLTISDVMRYCNWKDHDSPTSGFDLENSTEQGSYELNNTDQIAGVDSNAPYQILFTENGFTIVHLAAVSTTTSPLMMFGEVGELEKSKKQQQTELIEQASRRISDIDQASPNLASRTTLNEVQLTEDTSQKDSPSTLAPSQNKFSRGISLATLAKTTFVGLLLHLSKATLPVASAERLVPNPSSSNTTLWTPVLEKVKADNPITKIDYKPVRKEEISSLANAFIPTVILTCLRLEDHTAYTSATIKKWFQCEQFPNSNFYQRIELLKENSNSIFSVSPSVPGNPDFVVPDISKTDKYLSDWQSLAQEAEKKAKETQNPLAQEAWDREQATAVWNYIRDKNEILRLISYKMVFLARQAIPTKKAPTHEDNQEITAISDRAKQSCQDLLDHLTAYRHYVPAVSRSDWDDLTSWAEGEIARSNMLSLYFKREVLIREGRVASKEAVLNRRERKGIFPDPVHEWTEVYEWNEAIKKFREANQTSYALIKLFETPHVSDLKEYQAASEKKRVITEHEVLWNIAIRAFAQAEALQSDQEDKFIDRKPVPIYDRKPSMRGDQLMPYYIVDTDKAWEELINFWRKELKRTPDQEQQEWKEYLAEAELLQRQAYGKLLTWELEFLERITEFQKKMLKSRSEEERLSAEKKELLVTATPAGEIINK